MVFNDQRQRIGTIVDFVIVRNLPPAAIVEVGGFLGLGGHLVAVPFKSFVLDDTGRKITLPGATREALRNFPEFRFRPRAHVRLGMQVKMMSRPFTLMAVKPGRISILRRSVGRRSTLRRRKDSDRN